MAAGVEPALPLCNLVARGSRYEKKDERTNSHEFAFQSTQIAWGLCPLATPGLLPM